MNLVYNLTLVTLTSFGDQEMGLKFHSSVFQPPVCHSCQIYTRAFQTGSSSSQHGLTRGHLEPGLENKQASMHQNVIPVNKQHTKNWLVVRALAWEWPEFPLSISDQSTCSKLMAVDISNRSKDIHTNGWSFRKVVIIYCHLKHQVGNPTWLKYYK